MEKLFILFGAAITLLPILIGDLRPFEYYIGGVLLAFLGAAGSIMTYNWIVNRGNERRGLPTKSVPYTSRLIYSVVGSLICSTIATIWL